MLEEKFDPVGKLDEVCALLDKLAVKYEVHYHDEGEYSYLEEGGVCVTVINEKAERPLYIDLDDEFTVTFGRAWHEHCAPDDEGFREFCGLVKGILKNEIGIAEFFTAGKQTWLLSFRFNAAENEPPITPSVEEALKQYKIKGKIDVFTLFWDPKDDRTVIFGRHSGAEPKD